MYLFSTWGQRPCCFASVSAAMGRLWCPWLIFLLKIIPALFCTQGQDKGIMFYWNTGRTGRNAETSQWSVPVKETTLVASCPWDPGQTRHNQEDWTLSRGKTWRAPQLQDKPEITLTGEDRQMAKWSKGHEMALEVIFQNWVILLLLKCHFSAELEVIVVVKIVFSNTYLWQNRTMATQEFQKSGEAWSRESLSYKLIWYPHYYYHY